MQEKVDRSFLAKEAHKIHECAQENLNQISGRCATKETIQDYYLGILRRQAILTLDLKTILEKSPVDNLTTPLIICRCLVDDFLHIFYLHEENNEVENIVRINAEAYSENFKSLEGLTKSNHQHFEGRYALYMTGKELQEIKDYFASQSDNKKYFSNLAKFEFKRFITNAQLAEGIKDFELSKMSLRALFLWKQFSAFTHFTNLTFGYEMTPSNRDAYLFEIEETLLYSYNTVKWAFKFFEKRDGIKFFDNGLDDRYKIEKKSKS